MKLYSLEQRAIKFVKGYGILSFVRKYKKQLQDTGLYSEKNSFNKLVHKDCKFIEIADTVTKSNNDKIVKQEPFEETNIPPEKGGEILKKLRRVF